MPPIIIGSKSAFHIQIEILRLFKQHGGSQRFVGLLKDQGPELPKVIFGSTPEEVREKFMELLQGKANKNER